MHGPVTAKPSAATCAASIVAVARLVTVIVTAADVTNDEAVSAGPRASKPGVRIGGGVDETDGRRAQHAAGDADPDHRHRVRHDTRIGDARACESEPEPSARWP